MLSRLTTVVSDSVVGRSILTCLRGSYMALSRKQKVMGWVVGCIFSYNYGMIRVYACVFLLILWAIWLDYVNPSTPGCNILGLGLKLGLVQLASLIV